MTALRNKATSQPSRGLMIGLAFFVLIKLIAISFGLGSKEGPRLGDDSYVYLYYGELAGDLPLQMSGPSSLRDMVNLDTLAKADERSRFLVHRALMRTTQSSRLFTLWPIKLLPVEQLSFYQTFWIYELSVLAIITVGLGILASNLPSVSRLWLSLPLIALVILPGQGLHFFIPSTTALGFGMAIWGLVLNRRAYPVLLCLFAIGALSAHQIGLAHVAIGIGLAMTTWLNGTRTLPSSLIKAAALILATVAFGLIIRSMPVDAALVFDFTRFGLAPLIENISGFPNYFQRFAQRDMLSAALAVVGLVLLAKRKTSWSYRIIPHDPLTLLAFGLIAMIVLSSLYIIDGYAAEVPFRFVTILFILGILTLCHMWSWPVNPRYRRWTMVVVIAAAALSSLNYAIENRDKRWPELDRQVIARHIEAVPDDAPILYLDQDFTLMAGFLTGGIDHPAYVPALLALDPERSTATLAEAPPAAAVGLLPRGLRTRANLRWSLTSPARYGFDMSSTARLTIWTKVKIDRLSVQWDGAEPPKAEIEGGPSCNVIDVGDDRFDIGADCLAVLPAGKIIMRGEGFISGLAANDQPDKLMWPWDGPLTVLFYPGTSYIWKPNWFETSFSMQEIANRTHGWDAALTLEDMVPTSDEGGVIWLVPRENR